MFQLFLFYVYDLIHPQLYIHHVLVHVLMCNRNYHVSTFFCYKLSTFTPIGSFYVCGNIMFVLATFTEKAKPHCIPTTIASYIYWHSHSQMYGESKEAKACSMLLWKRGSKRLEIGGCKWTWVSYKIVTKFYKIWYLNKDSRIQCQLS
jgi:hypothetical protein